MEFISKSEDAFALRYAKKILAINLLGGKCRKCGNDDIFVLQFHHPHENKENDFNDIKSYRWSVIEKEIKKCDLLCANCHSEFHCDKDGYRHTQKLEKLNHINISNLECKQCGYSGKNRNCASLHFHHAIGDKNFEISDALNNTVRVSVQDLIDEIKKCIVICNNCHRKEHTLIDQFNRLKPYIDYKIEHYKELRPKLDRELIRDMYLNQKMRQVDIVRHFKCSKGTISMIIKDL